MRAISRLPMPTGAILAGLLLAPPTFAQCAVVSDLVPGPGSSSPASMVAAFGQDVYFTAWVLGVGSELWRWTETGGVTVIDVLAGAQSSSPLGMTPACVGLGPRLFFSAAVQGFGRELWMTDGTAAGTVMVKDIAPALNSSSPREFVECDGRVFFSADDGTSGIELWVTDGTAAGTQMVADIFPGATGGWPQGLVAVNDKVFFTADGPVAGRDLWVSDGTAAGTIRLGGTSFTTFAPSGYVPFRGELWFVATQPASGYELWKSDGTIAGTMLAVDILPGPSSSGPTRLTPCGELLFCAANSQPHATDGTAAGTRLLNPVPQQPILSPDRFTCAGDRVFFVANQSSTGAGDELWISDGTAAGTRLVKDIYPGPAYSTPNLLTAVGTGICFAATDANGSEMWYSDGTAAGTFLLCDIDPAGSSLPRELVACRGHLFFSANAPNVGYEFMQIQTPGADAEVLGAGGLPARPTLVTRDGAAPVLGSTIDLLAEGPAGHTGLLLVGASALPGPVVPALMQGGCDWVGLLAGTSLAVAATVQSSLTVPVAIPNQAALEGGALHLQMMWYDLSATPLVQLSNGLQLVLGSAAAH